MRVDLATVVFGWEKPLGVADHLLSKVSETATAQGRSEFEILEWRLAPDMFTLAQQFQSVTRLVGEWSARAVGADVPPDLPAESVGDLRTAISSTRQCLSALSPHQFSNRDEIPLTVDLGLIHPTLTTGQWILG